MSDLKWIYVVISVSVHVGILGYIAVKLQRICKILKNSEGYQFWKGGVIRTEGK